MSKTSLLFDVEKIISDMQQRMTSEASTIRSQVMAGSITASAASTKADERFQKLRTEAAQRIIDTIESKEK